MAGRVVFRDVVCQIGFAGAPVYLELLLFDAVADPMESHIDGFGALKFYGVVCKATGGGIVDLDGRWRLGMPHFLQCCTKDCGLFHICK